MFVRVFLVLALAPVPALSASAADSVLEAPPASVPAPTAATFEGLPKPYNWGFNLANGKTKLGFRVDLDLLAPLGTGNGNAAEYFKDFAKDNGPRLDEWEAARDRMITVEVDGSDRKVLGPDDPLLLEAEPWLDQARCRFYPEIFPAYQGWKTEIPNLLHAIYLGRSWVARAEMCDNSAAAAEDYRRTIRFGRLLLQDEATVIQNLIAIALIRMGAEGLYEQARNAHDGLTMSMVALALDDANVTRLEYQRWSQLIPELDPFLKRTDDNDWITLELPLEIVESMVERALTAPDQALTLESMIGVYLISRLAAEADHRALATECLQELAGNESEVVAASASFHLSQEIEPELIDELLQGPMLK